MSSEYIPPNFTNISSQHHLLIKDALLNRLSLMRKDLQPLLFDMPRPERDGIVQRINFLYALINKIKEEFLVVQDYGGLINQLEPQYPLAGETIREARGLLRV